MKTANSPTATLISAASILLDIPSGYGVARWAPSKVRIEYRPLSNPGLIVCLDTSPPEDVFKAYRHGTLEDVKTKAGLLNGAVGEGVNNPLALLAVQERRADVLKFCLETIDPKRLPYMILSNFCHEADSVNAQEDPETFKTVQESKFSKRFPLANQRVIRRGKKRMIVGAHPGVEKSFDVGSRFPVNW